MIDALSEAAAEMAKIREAIKTSDVNAITAIAPQLQTTQQKINDLDQMKKQFAGAVGIHGDEPRFGLVRCSQPLDSAFHCKSGRCPWLLN
jgi:hypothetical protein